MARPFWKGTLSFGLVEIGVTLQPARSGDHLSFSLLDRHDFSPVGYKRYNKRTGKDVPWDSVVRGYEYEDDPYVVLTDDELRQANAGASQTLDLVTFVDRGEIEPIYFDTPYFVLPLRKSSRGYSLLRDTLASTGLVGIVRVVLRRRLVEDMREAWKPEQYTDEYHHDVMAMIQKKVKSGKTHEIIPETETRAARAPREVVDLVPLLKRSLARRGGRAGTSTAPRAKPGRVALLRPEPARRRRA